MVSERKTKTRFSKKIGSILGIILVFIIFLFFIFISILYYNIAVYTPPINHLKLLFYNHSTTDNNNIYTSTDSDIELDSTIIEEGLKKDLKRAEEFISTNNIDSALSVYRRIVRRYPSLIPIRLKLARLLENIGEIEEAEEQYKQAYTYQKNDKNVIIILTDFMIERKKYDEALFYLSKYENYNKSKKNIDADIVSRQFFLHYLKRDLSTAKRYLNIYRLWIETNAALYLSNEKVIKLTTFLINSEEYQLATDVLIKKLNFELKNKNYDYDLFILTMSLLIKLNKLTIAKEIVENTMRLNLLKDDENIELVFWKNIINIKQNKNNSSEVIKSLEYLYSDDKLSVTQNLEFALVLYDTNKTDKALVIVEKHLPKLKNKLSEGTYYIKNLYSRIMYVFAKILENKGDIYKSSSVVVESILNGYYDIKLINIFIRNLIRKDLYIEAEKLIQTYFDKYDVKLSLSKEKHTENILKTKYYLALIELNLKNYDKCREIIRVLEKNNFDPKLIKELKVELILRE